MADNGLPKDAPFILIRSEGGRIGRIGWRNARQHIKGTIWWSDHWPSTGRICRPGGPGAWATEFMRPTPGQMAAQMATRAKWLKAAAEAEGES
jgi:hypothetical protein